MRNHVAHLERTTKVSDSLKSVPSIDLNALTFGELRSLHADLEREMRRRGISRTEGNLAGEIGERLAQIVYGGALATPVTKGWDLVDPHGLRIQVKTRSLPSGDHRFFSFTSFDFDLAVCVRFDRDTHHLEWAREFTLEQVQQLASPCPEGLRLRTRQAALQGRDVTEAFRAAYDHL